MQVTTLRKTLFEKDIGWRLPAGSGRHIFVCVALFLFLVVIYGNSLRGEWIFDDGPNIVENVNVHVKTLSWEEIRKTFYIAGTFSRPVSYLSFGINHYFGGLHVFGYHLVNLIIHYITALLLFFFILRTLKLPLLKEQYKGSAYAIALIATLLWAINPIQALSVSYIVQRMASMAGMFYILSLYCYLRGRTGDSRIKNMIFFLLSLVSYLLALGSKENVAMLPVAIFFYDLFLIQGVTRKSIKRNIKIFIVPVLIVFFLAIIYTDLAGILGGDSDRPFTLKERLLTEPRIIIFYLSLLFYPLSSRLAMFHDIELSKSFFDPWTTMPAILLILLINCYALYTARKRPLISFAIIFFFLNHLIEGTIIPLELIYEHRNYIPSMFLFIPIALLLVYVLDLFSRRNSIQFLVILLTLSIFISQGHTVYMRNEIIGQNLTLWLDNVKKAPNLSRVHNNLGNAFLEYGLRSDALKEFKMAQHVNKYSKTYGPATVEYNIGHFYITEGEYDRAFSHFMKSLSHRPGFSFPLSGIAIIRLRQGNPKDAYQYITKALQRRPNSPEYRELLSVVLFKLGMFKEAFMHAQELLHIDSERIIPLAVLAEVFRKRGRTKETGRYWELYLQKAPESLVPYFILIDLYSELENHQRLDYLLSQLIDRKGDMSFDDLFDNASREKASLLFLPDKSKLMSLIKRNLLRQSHEIKFKRQ